MQLMTKESWTTRCCCCGTRTSSLLIFLMYIVLHISLLSISFLTLNSLEELVDYIIAAVDTTDKLLEQSDLYKGVKQTIVENPEAYTSIPIILNLILLISNWLATFGALFQSYLLLFPWLILYCASILCSITLLVCVVAILQDIWLRVILFLVIVPLLVIAISSWAVILRLAIRIKTIQRKFITQLVKPPITLQLSSSVDHPLPISAMAVSPPQSAWDPEYLIERDPRFLSPQSRHTADSPDSEIEMQGSHSCEGQSDRGQTGGFLSDSQSDWESEGESDYQSDEYTDRGAREDTEDFTESEAEILDTHQQDGEFDNDLIGDAEEFTESDAEILKPVNSEPVPYDTPGIPRPVSRTTPSRPGNIVHSSEALHV